MSQWATAGARDRPGASPVAAPPAPARTAARAVIGLQRAVGNRAVAQLMRQPATGAPAAEPQVRSVAPGAERGQILVTLDNGARYRVTRKARARRVIDSGRPRVGVCSDDRRVWMRIAWCQGTRGRIDVGANPQGALEDLLDSVGRQIGSGASADTIVRTITDASLQPFAEVEIARANSWRVTGDVRVDVNRTGATGATGGLRLDLGWIRIGVTGSTGAGDDRIGGQIEIPIPEPGVRVEPCPKQQVEVLWEYTCEREHDETDWFTPAPMPRHEEDAVFLYFDYEKDVLRSSPRAATAQANQAALLRLDELIAGGFRVTQITGQASPEGPQTAPAPTRPTRNDYQDNTSLAAKRAQAVRTMLHERFMLRPRAIDRALQVVGQGELPRLTRTVRRNGQDVEEELSGRALERAVVERFTSSSEEMNRLPEPERRFITNPRNSLHARAQRIYEWQRRVEVRLAHDWMQTFDPIPMPTVRRERLRACPAVVEQAADRYWGPRIPFTAPEPSVCRQN